ncbi:MAG TPA: hypothetical protein VHN98_01925 [Acidimicrobiales bacterium]|nr:hypothetical protein [Acidimicrobiales bacterium]
MRSRTRTPARRRGRVAAVALVSTMLASGGVTWMSAGVAAASTSTSVTITDPTGDPTPVADARGDIVEVAASYSPAAVNPTTPTGGLQLSLTPAQYTDPASDPGWNGITGIGWSIDTDRNGRTDWLALEEKSGAVLVDRSFHRVCSVASYPGSGVYRLGIPAECIGGAVEVRVGAVMIYDPDGDPSTPNEVTDAAPDGLASTPISAEGYPDSPAPGLQGYWTAAADGGLNNFGIAESARQGGPLNQPVVGMATLGDGASGWMVATDGGIFAFGGAGFFGSTGDIKLNKPIVGMAATPDGRGYWLVASDGGIFAFGDARFRGSTGAMTLNKPIVGMARTLSGDGYWLAASDGGIFAYGDAAFYGSTGNIALNKPIVGISRTRSGAGYRFVASDGGVFSYGDAAYEGAAVGGGSPTVAIASV